MAQKKVAGNVGITYNSNALDAYLNTSSINAVVNAIESTNFDSTGEERIAGLAEWSVDVGGPWDPTLDGYLGPDGVSPPTTMRDLSVDIDTVNYAWTGSEDLGAFISDYTIDSSSPSDGITWSGTLTCSGIPTRT